MGATITDAWLMDIQVQSAAVQEGSREILYQVCDCRNLGPSLLT